MNQLFSLVMTLLMIGTTMMKPLPGQPPAPLPATKKPVVFACDLKALTPAQRKRQSEFLSPALKAAKPAALELRDGYRFLFPADAKTFATVSEWIGNERLCCPFFLFDIHVGDSSTPISLQITGRKGVKEFIQAELHDLFD